MSVATDNPSTFSGPLQTAFPLIKAESLIVNRGGRNILGPLSWAVERGQNWVILGPNGAGKTTLARLICGRDYLDSGTLQILGGSLEQYSGAELSTQVGLASIEVAERIPADENSLSVVLAAAWGQNLSFQEEYENSDIARAKDLLAALGIAELEQRAFLSLSEGEKRRVLIARSLMSDPEILILDEPTAGLDLGGREILLRALKEIIKSKAAPTVVLITHELEEINENFTHGLLLKDGQIVARGPLDEVLTAENLSETFGIALTVTHKDGRWWAVGTESWPQKNRQIQ